MYWALSKKNKTIIYKKWRRDIWGLYTTRCFFKHDRKITYLLKLKMRYLFNLKKRLSRLVYKVTKKPFNLSFKKLKLYFFSLRLTSYYYLTLRPREFRVIYNNAWRKKGSFVSNYCLFLEARSMNIIYRCNFITNIFMLRFWINSGYFNINNTPVYYHNLKTHIGDIISINTQLFCEIVLRDLLLRLQNKVIFFNTPRFIFLNWDFVIAILTHDLQLKDLAFTNPRFDIFRGGEFIK